MIGVRLTLGPLSRSTGGFGGGSVTATEPTAGVVLLGPSGCCHWATMHALNATTASVVALVTVWGAAIAKPPDSAEHHAIRQNAASISAPHDEELGGWHPGDDH